MDFLSTYVLNYLHITIPSFWGVTTGGAGGPCHRPPPNFNFWPKKGPAVSFSSIRGIDFYGYSEIIWTRLFTIFTVYATIFG